MTHYCFDGGIPFKSRRSSLTIIRPDVSQTLHRLFHLQKSKGIHGMKIIDDKKQGPLFIKQ